MRHRFVILLALVVPALLAGCRTGDPAARTAAPLDVGVMTFNIRYGTAGDGEDAWPNRREMVQEVIATTAPDVAGLQEALRFQLDELRAALPQYAETGVGRDDGVAAGEHSAILYRSDRFALDEHGTFWFSDTPQTPGSTSWGNSIPRICTWARFIETRPAAARRAFYLYNVHLDHRSQPSRRRSVALLADRIAARTHPDPVIVTGDFNAGERTDEMAPLLTPGPAGEAPPFLDTFRVLYPDAPDAGTFNAFRGLTDGEKIDSILVEPGAPVLAAEILRTSRGGRYPSDHFPVTARVQLHATKPTAVYAP